MSRPLILVAVLLFGVAICIPQGDKDACEDGYRKNENGECDPICIRNCTNGECTAPGKCECYDGYKYNWETGNCDEKLCRRDCPGSRICTAKDTCSCRPGYYDDYDNRNNCVSESVCPGGCKDLPRGICTAGGCAQTLH